MSNSVHWPSAVVSDIADEYDAAVFEVRDFGSKAKNMQGSDSDTDGMALYSQPPEDHKHLGRYDDSICREMYGVDIQAWSLTKFGSLLADSNPTAIEFLNSNIIYYRKAPKHDFTDLFWELRQYANRNFNPIRLYFHYRHMGRDNYNQYIKNENRPTVKKNLTVARSVLYARHIRRTHEFPGMDFEKFLNNHVEDDLANRVWQFLEMKRNGKAKQAVDNPFEDIAEYEFDLDMDEDELNRRGIENERVNEFMQDVDDILF